MRKIVLTKKETVKKIIEKISEEEKKSKKEINELVLIFPKNFEHKTKSFFEELKNYAQKNDKVIIIESVDEDLLLLANSLDFKTQHPLFSNFQRLTDVLPPTPKIEHHLNLKNIVNQTKKEKKPEEIKTKEVKEEKEIYFKEDFEEEKPKIHHKRKAKSLKIFKFLLWILVILGLAFGFYKISYLLASSEISLKFKKTPWEFNKVVNADKNVNSLNSSGVLPAEIFKNQSNLTQLFKANGKKYVEEKAKGIITIYNAYSSEEQVLVATTRFQAPNRLIYRLTERVVVPGAQIKEGKIIPSSITAEVVADKPGAEYNTGPVAKLTIPGFAGSPKFEKFYGELKEGAKGGFIGEKNVPTNNDIENAKEKVKSILETNLKNSILSGKKYDFKIIGEPLIEFKRLSANTSTDENGNFAVFGDANITALGIREKDVLALLNQSLEDKNKVIKNLEIKYLNPKINFDNGTASFNLVASGYLVYNLNSEELKDLIKGKSIYEAQNIIKSLPELESAKILIKPRWIKYLPKNSQKISIKWE
jgi:hypothetical protein